MTTSNSAHRRLHVAIAALAMMLLLASGCHSSGGPERARARGKVTVNGQALARGSIEFIPEDGTLGPKAAAEIINGEYDIDERDGPVVGTVRVRIHSVQQPVFALDDPQAHAMHLQTQRGMVAGETDVIPPQYNEQSTLIRTIAGDDNVLNFALETGDKQ